LIGRSTQLAFQTTQIAARVEHSGKRPTAFPKNRVTDDVFPL
jgi:hypothetical protein